MLLALTSAGCQNCDEHQPSTQPKTTDVRTSAPIIRVSRRLTKPEETALLHLAMRARDWHERMGSYPRTWNLIIDAHEHWSYDGFFENQIGAPPTPVVGTMWTPSRHAAAHSFAIAHADERRFRFEAVDAKGRVTWFIDESSEDATQLLPVYCTLEDDRTVPEPLRFFDRATHLLHQEPKPLPTRWSQLKRMHWSNREHFREDSSTGPPDSTRWKPIGSLYTYELTADADARTYIIRSHNTSGKPNYLITHASREAVELPD